MAFRLIDVVCPDFEQIVQQLGPELPVSGLVAFVSDRGAEEGCFAIVDVNGIHTPLIVPAACITLVDNAATAGKKASWVDPGTERLIAAQAASVDRRISADGEVGMHADQPADGEAAG